MEPHWQIAPYNYNITNPDAPISSLQLLMMQSKKQYDIVNPPKVPEPELSGKIHYDYGKAYKRIKL